MPLTDTWRETDTIRIEGAAFGIVEFAEQPPQMLD